MIEGISGLEVCRRAPPHARDRQRADHHADRPRRGGGPGARARDRRRRLCHQAVQPARAGRPGAGGAAPGAAGAGRRAIALRRPRNGHCRPQGEARRARRSRSARPSSACCAISSNIPAASSRASGCSTRSGAATATSRSRTVDVHIRRLRQAINLDGQPRADPDRPLRRLRARRRCRLARATIALQAGRRDVTNESPNCQTAAAQRP